MGAYYGQSHVLYSSILKHQKYEGQKTALWEGLDLLVHGDKTAAFKKYVQLVRHQGGRAEKIAALSKGIELGLNLIDTAEIYQTEDIVAEAAKYHRREDLFIATKVSGAHLNYEMVLKAADRSLKNLQSSYIDLYQIHWSNPKVPIAETMKAMEKLIEDGKIRYIGVSTFSVRELKHAEEALSKNKIASNQVEYNLMNRTMEKDLLPYCEQKSIAIMAFLPLARGALVNPGGKLQTALEEISRKHGGKTPAQIALNWQRRKSNIIFPIPRASSPRRVVENAGSAGWSLDKQDIKTLEASA